jgi:hypothetical protein
MKRIILISSLALVLGIIGNPVAADWRKSGDDAEKLRNLVAALPGTSHWMFEVGERYKNLYWAAKQEKWEFAEYQLEEIESLVKLVKLTRPQRTASADEFLDSAIPRMEAGLATREWKTFKSSFKQLSQACMHCHAQNDHAFVVLPAEPKSASSPVLNLRMDED